MMSLTPGDVVWVPYPHVNDNRRRPRPALIAASGLGPEGALCWALMITNASRPDWPGDVTLADHDALGLPIPSKVRTDKIATIEARTATHLGRLPPDAWDTVAGLLNSRFSG